MIALRTLAVMAWFSAMFFVLGPYLVLRASGSSFAEGFGQSPLIAKIVVGLVLLALSLQVGHFVRVGSGTPAPFDPPRHFVATGIYRATRNPMYLLYVVVMAAEAWLFTSWALVLYTVGFFALAHLYVTRIEEPGLRTRFGQSYDTYCAKVPRWFPMPSAGRNQL